MVFESGKTYGVIGPNGAGKITLFKCMTRLILLQIIRETLKSMRYP
ncbi:ATP-binding cassette domain-containing protein [Vagococcus sp. CY53-2]